MNFPLLLFSDKSLWTVVARLVKCGPCTTLVHSRRKTELAKAVYDVLFEGTQVDWHNVFNAKIDKRFVRTISDKVTTIQSGNDEAIYRNYKKWYPVNGNMHYNEKEEGDKIKNDMDIATVENAKSKFSADGITGVGDLWVFDFFTCASRVASDELRFQPNGTFFWHER